MKVTKEKAMDWMRIFSRYEPEDIQRALLEHMRDEKYGDRMPAPIHVLRRLTATKSSGRSVVVNLYHGITNTKYNETRNVGACIVDCCDNPGTGSAGIGDDWYCANHYREFKG